MCVTDLQVLLAMLRAKAERGHASGGGARRAGAVSRARPGAHGGSSAAGMSATGARAAAGGSTATRRAAGSSSAIRLRARSSRRSTPAGSRIGDEHAARARLLAHARARGADRDRRGMLPQPGHDARRARADRDRRSRDVRQQLLRRRLRPSLRRPGRARSPSRASSARGPVRIGSNCWFGVNCVVTGGVEIGERAVIGANSVVTPTSPPG